MSRFVDRSELRVIAGNGGNGCASVHREKFKPLGGPDGGNGGRGGDIVLVVDPGMHTLLDFHHRRQAKARNGKQGQGDMRNGAVGEDLVLSVPDGTVVLDDKGEQLADLVGAGTRFVVAAGGRGGLGNAALSSTARRAPGFALLGEPGEERDVVLELRSLADVGLIGFPSAGKSSLVAAMSQARPKIADYPFTTLVPQLGVVSAGESTFTVADVPGLIPGAAEGRGLGLEFLRHIERCAVLVHVIDCATIEPGRDPVSDLAALEAELARYIPGLGGELAGRPRIIALNKIDVPEAAELAEFVTEELAEQGWPVVSISTATHAGLRELTFLMAREVARYRAALPPPEPTRLVLRPHAVGEIGFTVEVDPEYDGAFVVRGERPERWVRQTQFDNDEAVGYLADRLAKLGVEDALAKAGAVAGAEVTIGGVTFDWEPSTPSGAIVAMGNRGTDPRLARSTRPRAAERKSAKLARRAHLDDVADDEFADSLEGTGAERDRVSTRAEVAAAARLVVKVGSSALTSLDGGLDHGRLDALVDALAARRATGAQVILVSSGAIAAGLAPLGLSRRPRDLASQQAAASVGQLLLAHAYASSFARHGVTVGQVLLTADDVIRRSHYRNAQRTLIRLLSLRTLPVVNENDTVATDEIRVGDNDRLAALVAHLVGAEALVLLSDVDGLYDGDPRKPGSALLPEIDDLADLAAVDVNKPGTSGLGRGGMATKIEAATMAASAGIPVLLAAADDAALALDTSADGPKLGTAFRAGGQRLSARRFWLRHAADVRGQLDLDDGAVAAVLKRRRSLLAAGVHGVRGDFVAGDVVDLVGPNGTVVARGVVAFDAAELPGLIGRRTRDLPPEFRRELVHADDLVPLR